MTTSRTCDEGNERDEGHAPWLGHGSSSRATVSPEALETVELHEEDGVTTMTDRLAFKDQAARDSMTWAATDGVHSDQGGQVGWDRLEDYLATLA
jgi:hypothetical protein